MWMRILMTAAAITAIVQTAPAADRESEFRGKRIAEANCAACHAIAPYDSSEHPEAPPFRGLGRVTSLTALREDLAGALFLRHPEMPDFEPTLEQADDIYYFIQSLQQ